MTDDQQPLNRAERRRRRFHPRQGGHVQDNLVPEDENVSARRAAAETGTASGSATSESDETAAPNEAVAGDSNEGAKRTTGAGAGGATESDSRLVHHEGIHQPSRPNG